VDDTPLDAERILQSLTEHSVDYLLIGGLAAQAHGQARVTSNADVIASPESGNLGRLALALRSLDARALNPGHEKMQIDAQTLQLAPSWRFATRDGGIEVMYKTPRGVSFSEVIGRALHVSLGEINVPVIGLDDLIGMKLAHGRPIDIADVAALIDSENV
jgi:hypothetical protein